ncbi:serine/threonine-protein kinase/endoribonuclease IRE1-like [Phragmites australis]|uniref:serine/threonine-protein kinase/endoribonuclease IRE1-like n=1 Tax=Phragmites australis TaxID=29695 RepID=UPI002D766EA6|nr:serine/threonine-protein kinase/endoribonuclease IRE1-like [Phragmites australis]
MRSLRRVILPLVLLAGIAFRGVGLDASPAALHPSPSPPPPRLALPLARGGGGPEDGAAARSTEIVAVAARSTEIVVAAPPKKQRPGDLLVRPQPPRAEPTSAVSGEADAEARSVLQFYDNGTIQLVDRLSKSPLWEISTGPPLSNHISTAEDLSYLIYPSGGKGNDLWEVHNGTGAKLPWKLDEFVARTPYIRDSVVTIGSKVPTVFVVDADCGEIIYKQSIPASLNDLEGPVVDGTPSKLNVGTSDGRDNIVVVVRTDYSLSASDLGKHLFNWTRTSFTAKYYTKYNHPDMLDQPSCMRGDIPCIRTEGVPRALPDSSLANAISSIDATTVTFSDADADAMKSLQTLWKSPQTDGMSNVVSDGAQNQTYNGSLSHFISVDPEATNKSTKNTYGWLFPVFPILLVIGCLLSLTSAKSCRQFVIQLMNPLMRDRKPMDTRGRSEGTPKRRKTRKKDGLVNSHETLSASDKENSETCGSTEEPIKENSALTNKRIAEGLDGRQIGKLYVSNKEIGRGSNGTVVFEGSYDGRQVAVKRLLRSHNDIAEKETQNLIISDRDPNIVRLYGCDHDSDFVYISLERCQCSLADLIQKHSYSSSEESIAKHEVTISIKSKISNVEGVNVELWMQDGLPSAQLLKLMRDVVAGLVHLHNLGIIHRDLKPQNVLISTEGPIRAKLSDMGISKLLQDDMTSVSHHGTGIGSSGWQAPEQLRHGRQTRAMDLFSLGCLIFYCITKGKHPFGEYYERDMNIVNNHFDLFVVDYIPEAVHLISQLLLPNPEMRPTAVYVMHHPLFWGPELRLSFLRDTSDRIEKTSEIDLINALESIGLVAFGGKWGEKLDAALVTDMGRYRKYNFESIRDLLRYIRNKSGHYRELSDDLKALLGSLPEGFDRYFSSRFPKLLIEVYKVMWAHCKDEEAFSKYFNGSSV